MVIMFDPMLDNWSCILFFEPCPMATMAITAPTPMMIPSIVRKARNLFRCNARNAIRKRLKSFIYFIINSCGINLEILRYWLVGKHFFCGAHIFVFAILYHTSVL